MPLDQIDVDNMQEKETQEMTFLEHLEELRWHIIRSLIAIVLFGIILFVFQKWFFEVVVFGPSKPDFISYQAICNLSKSIGLGEQMCFTPPIFETVAIGFGEAFITSIKVSFIAGFILAFPFVFGSFGSLFGQGYTPKSAV